MVFYIVLPWGTEFQVETNAREAIRVGLIEARVTDESIFKNVSEKTEREGKKKKKNINKI